MAIVKPDHALEDAFQQKVQRIQDWFIPLNPYDDNKLLFEMEDINYNHVNKHELLPLYCLAISSKRYVLYNVNEVGEPIIRKASAHGLGHLCSPYTESPSAFPAPSVPLGEIGIKRWQYDLWYHILINTLHGTHTAYNAVNLEGFDIPCKVVMAQHHQIY